MENLIKQLEEYISQQGLSYDDSIEYLLENMKENK